MRLLGDTSTNVKKFFHKTNFYYFKSNFIFNITCWLSKDFNNRSNDFKKTKKTQSKFNF